MGGGVFTDFKSSNRIEISRLVEVLLNFYWFWGSPLVGGEWVDRVGWREGVPHTCAHAHMCMHAHIWHHRNSHEFPKNPMGVTICMKLSCLPHMCMCVCVHACTCVCMCVWGTPNHPQPIHPPLNHAYPIHPPPTPRAAGSPKHTNSISLELIEIIQFCLKILYLWTFLNSYRL